MSSIKRMSFIDSNEEMREAIIENLKEGIRENMPCPCPDCDGTLRKKTLKYTNTDSEPWTLIEIDVFACKCGFQVKYKEAEEQ